MPTNHVVDLCTGSGVKLEDVRFSFGSLYSSARKRSFREGGGFSIELPAVLDLLDAIAQGGLDASSAREELLNKLDVLYDEAGCYDYESPRDKLSWCIRDGGCPICTLQQKAFTRHLAMMAERWRRWTLSEQFPFAAGNAKGLHTVGCGVVHRHMPDDFPDHKPDNTEALRAFAHLNDPYEPFPQGLDQLPGYLPFHPMSAEEARAWMAEHTGPKGGRYYKRCRHCAPAP